MICICIYIYKSQGGIPSKCESSARPEYAPALCKSVMPLEFLGCARATLALSMRLWLGMIIIIMIKIMIKHIYIHIYIYVFNEEFLVSASHQPVLNAPLYKRHFSTYIYII